MRFVLVLSLLMLLNTWAFAESRRTPAINNNISQSKNSAYNETPPDKGSKEHPFFVKMAVPIPKDDKEAKADETERSRKASIEAWTIAISCITAVILLFQSIVFIVQARRLRDTVEATKEAAKALPLIERAYVFVSVKLGDVKLRENGEFIFHDPAFNTTTLSIVVKLTNQGKTPAILDSIYGGWVPQTDCPTKATVVGLIETKVPKGIVIASGDNPFIVNVLPPPVISDKDWKLIFASEIKFFCYGRIEYKDVLGKDRRTGFCWEFVPDSKDHCFTISDSDLNEYT